MHCIAICILLWLWFREQRPNLHTARGVANIIGAAVVGTLLAVLFPSAGLALIVSGQALITSGVATFLYAALSPTLPVRKLPANECPECGLINLPAAQACDCGYRFEATR